jgi:hypothetical protein
MPCLRAATQLCQNRVRELEANTPGAQMMAARDNAFNLANQIGGKKKKKK